MNYRWIISFLLAIVCSAATSYAAPIDDLQLGSSVPSPAPSIQLPELEAASLAFKDGMSRARPTLLEPVMDVEVVTPEDYLGDVMGDINSRRGHILHLEPRGNAQAIRARVPLATMFGYATDLRSTTQGRATFTMQFDRYEEVPQSIAGEIVDAEAK